DPAMTSNFDRDSAEQKPAQLCDPIGRGQANEGNRIFRQPLAQVGQVTRIVRIRTAEKRHPKLAVGWNSPLFWEPVERNHSGQFLDFAEPMRAVAVEIDPGDAQANCFSN